MFNPYHLYFSLNQRTMPTGQGSTFSRNHQAKKINSHKVDDMKTGQIHASAKQTASKIECEIEIKIYSKTLCNKASQLHKREIS